MFQACTAESRFCVFVWWCSCAASFALRHVSRLSRGLALLERGLPCSSVVSISVCVVRTSTAYRTLCDTPHWLKAHEIIALVIPAQFIPSHRKIIIIIIINISIIMIKFIIRFFEFFFLNIFVSRKNLKVQILIPLEIRFENFKI